MRAQAHKIVAYLGVSTQQQGCSDLGLEAQRAAVEGYVAQRGATVVRWFTEIESGKVNRHAELTRALHLVKVTGATLLIAKLDRLSRNAAFLLTLRDSGVRFIAADMPGANELTVGIMALVAQQEREAISKRTCEALEAVRLLRQANRGNAASLQAIRAKADAHARALEPVLEALGEEGITTLRELVSALNERGMLTPRQGQWHAASVRALQTRLAAL